MTVPESGVKRQRMEMTATDIDRVRLVGIADVRDLLSMSLGCSQTCERALQAADLEQFLFGSASAAADDFGKELNQVGDQSEVTIAEARHPALSL